MRLIFLLILFVVGIGFFLHTKTEIPYFQWIGHLPGDLVIHKGGAKIYIPLTTSLIISVGLSLLFSKWSRSSHD